MIKSLIETELENKELKGKWKGLKDGYWFRPDYIGSKETKIFKELDVRYAIELCRQEAEKGIDKVPNFPLFKGDFPDTNSYIKKIFKDIYG